MYVSGATSSTDFPVTGYPISTLKAGATTNVFVAKFDPTGATLLFATYFGGTGADSRVGIAVDAAGNIYVAGTTTSTDFPTSTSAFQTTPKSGPETACVRQRNWMRLARTCKYSTYLSGSTTVAGTPNDIAKGMTLDNKGFVYVIGITDSTDFPTAPSGRDIPVDAPGSHCIFYQQSRSEHFRHQQPAFSTYFGGGIPSTGNSGRGRDCRG